jgi:hypothetical protein
MNGLRSRVRLQVDGGLRTGRDVVSRRCSAPRSSASPPPRWWPTGCVMLRKCHLNTCSVGIATQDPSCEAASRQARARRALLHVRRRGGAALAGRRSGCARSTSSWGGSSCCAPPTPPDWKASALDLGPLLARRAPPALARSQVRAVATGVDARITSITRCSPSRGAALDRGARRRSRASRAQHRPRRGRDAERRDRAAHGARGPARRDLVHLRPPAARPARASGPSWRAGVTLDLEGDANDYVGKGLSGGRVVVPPAGVASCRGARSSSATRCSTGPRAARCSCGARGRALRGAQQRRPGGGRGRGRPRLRVHDRRRGGGARPDGPQLRRRHERRRGLRVRSDAGLPDPLQPRHGRARAARRRRRVAGPTLLERPRRATPRASSARRLLDTLGPCCAFVKVMPVEYRRVLEALRASKRDAAPRARLGGAQDG